MDTLTDNHIKEFLENSPLYSWKEFKKPDFNRNSLWINEIDAYCETCRQHRPFQDLRSSGGGAGMPEKQLTTGQSFFQFICVSCRKEKHEYLVNQIVTDGIIKFQKYGELPRKHLDRDPILQKFFSNDKDNYKKAVICLANGYGIAAFVYISGSITILPTLNYYTPLTQAMLLTIPFGIGMGMFFAPVTVLILQSAPKNKGELAIVLMDYFRFVGGSFGTALATNNMEYFKALNFDRMTQIQNFEYINLYLNNLAHYTNMSLDKIKAIFSRYEEFMSFNYGFYNTFMHAGYWGIFGSIFVISLFVFKGTAQKEKCT